jgi:IPT/TIG domain
MFFMFTPQNVGSCFDAGNGSCAYTQYCAYHGFTPSGAIYANQPYAKAGGCDLGQYPNGNDADPTINVVSHEHAEAITDPKVNINSAWYDSAGYEIGDKCAWTFGTRSGSPGAQYDQTINGHHYFMQEEYSNDGHACDQTYTIQSGGGKPVVSGFSPSRGRAGTLVTLTGQNFGNATQVLLRFTNAQIISETPTTIKTKVPTGVTGLAQWTVKNPAGSGKSSTYFCAC